jgi:rhodanese-related sulfurtransferase
MDRRLHPPPRITIGTLWRALGLVLAGAALGLAVNAYSPRGIPLAPMTRPTDRPPEGVATLPDDYLSFETLQAASESGVEMGFVVIVDARTPEEFDSGHVPGAINIPTAAFLKGRPEGLGQIPRDADVIIYCDDRDCASSRIVAEQLRLYGFGPDGVRVFTPGYPAWEVGGGSGAP